MAILPQVPGITVSICVDGKPLEEYMDDEVEEGAEDNAAQYSAAIAVSHYIESVSDKEYTIQVDVDPTFNFNCPTLLIDTTIDRRIRAKEVIAGRCIGGHLANSVKKVVSHVKVDVPPVRGQNARTDLKAFRFAKIGKHTSSPRGRPSNTFHL